MAQNRITGAAGDRFGRDAGPRIMNAIGAQRASSTSNECLLNGERMVVKCAHRNTSSVGVSLQMLQHLHSVLGAFETDDGSYRVIRISAEQYTANMSDTRSRGPSAGKVGIVRRDVLDRQGQVVGTVRI